MPIASRKFEDNIIKTVVGIIVLVVAASLVAAGGSLMYGAAFNAIYIIPGVLVFIVGVVLLIFSMRILLLILKGIGIDLEQK